MYKKYIKRIIDIFLASLVGMVFLPFLIIISVLIKIEDRGPVFYLGDRIGKDCKKFKMIKFRSMKFNAPDIRNGDGSTFNSRKDPRVTKIGRVLRETSLDEIPQIFNVIKGDMSLLGPRASTWDALESFKSDEMDKMKVRPGISGFTQAYYRNGLSLREKRLKDAWYATNVSFGLDIKIFFKTIFTVLRREGLYTNNDIKVGEKERNIKDVE
ncbi:sugar transferase [Salinicoccus roseus]|uniref:sugar transferase n=1 Tax=Salinicoccus roseus TaxID=45670 RepID=UPI0023010DDD|nr:sugar transferase [Salinicoccus roseus]